MSTMTEKTTYTPPSLTIGDLTAPVPIIQGGMGVGVSMAGLASAVAKAGGYRRYSIGPYRYERNGLFTKILKVPLTEPWENKSA